MLSMNVIKILTFVISLSAGRLLLSASPTSDKSLFRLDDFVMGLGVSSAIMIVWKQWGAMIMKI